MFVPDNIRDGSSLEILYSFGKIEGLITKLKTDSKVISLFNIILKRIRWYKY